MAGGIAHEINTPLGAILLCAQTVQQELDATEIDKNSIKKLALKIETIVGRIAKIIQALRAYSRGNNTDPFLDTPIHQIIENSVSLVREKLRLRGIEIRGLDSVEKGLFIQCREAQIGQVIMNLLGNSADAIEKLDKKWVEIEVEDLGENIRIKITDSVKGIQKHLHDKIFDPFFTSKDIGKGTGLGLSISAGAIQEHHGAIFVDANSKNTCFVIHLPKMQISNEEDPFSEAA